MCFESDTIREERLRNKEIDKEIREASEKIEREAKILLLGMSCVWPLIYLDCRNGRIWEIHHFKANDFDSWKRI